MSSMKRFSLNSLRSQLLLWIILPLLVVLLTFALTGVQGHGQAMHEMVQTRADGLARAAAALVAMRVDRSQNELLRLSSLPALHEDVLDPGMVIGTLERELAEFPGGLGLYQDGRLQIAAEEGGALGLILVRGRAFTSAAETRWQCDAGAGGGWVWTSTKSKRGTPGAWRVSWKGRHHASDLVPLAATASA